MLGTRAGVRTGYWRGREGGCSLAQKTDPHMVPVGTGPGSPGAPEPPWMVRVPGVVLYPAGFLCPDPAALALGATRTLLVLSCCAECFCGDLTVWIQETSRHWRPPPHPRPCSLGLIGHSRCGLRARGQAGGEHAHPGPRGRPSWPRVGRRSCRVSS